MKKKNIFLQLALTAALLASTFSTTAHAAEATTTRDIPVGGSGQVEMVGTIEPTILSVTMPSFVPFNISNSLSTQNKVISPRINVKNNSNVPVQVDVASTKVDISKLKNTTWSNTGAVNDNQIAIGLKQEDTPNTMPTDLANTRWLKDNQTEEMNVMVLNSNQEGAMYVVGTLGQKVSESATFNVTPTFVVSQTSGN
ncbi:MAG: hypothetical protein HFH42_01020 [Lachnospiraceae bacterium]|jgi:hypothetical protein|nr:hypothetical protein [Lachnospiraceae bacterium]